MFSYFRFSSSFLCCYFLSLFSIIPHFHLSFLHHLFLFIFIIDILRSPILLFSSLPSSSSSSSSFLSLCFSLFHLIYFYISFFCIQIYFVFSYLLSYLYFFFFFDVYISIISSCFLFISFRH